jgi:hypothetical protein
MPEIPTGSGEGFNWFNPTQQPPVESPKTDNGEATDPDMDEVADRPREPVTDAERAESAVKLQEYLSGNLERISKCLAEQVEMNAHGEPSIISVGHYKRGGYGTAIVISKNGLRKVSLGPSGGYTSEPNQPADQLPEATAQSAVEYFELVGRDPRDISKWLDGRLEEIEEYYEEFKKRNAERT